MKSLIGVAGLALAFAVPGLAQTAPAPQHRASLKSVAWQDQDDVRRQDRDDRDRDNNGRRNRRDRDRDRDRDRGRDRDNGQYRRNQGYYGNGQYGRGGYGQYGRGGYGNYHNVLAPEWQSKFDSYYQRWLQYRSQGNQGEVSSMEGRMRDIMTHYNIPLNVPYSAVASPGIGGGYYGNGRYGNGGYYGRGDNDRDDYPQGGYPQGAYGRGGYGGYHNVLAPEWQSKFDSYYQRWLQYRSQGNQGEVASMEGRMRDIMSHYNIPTNVPFSAVASNGGYYGR